MVFSGFFDEPKQQRVRQKYTVKDKQPYYKAQNGKCNGCKRSVPIDLMHLDHIRAFAKGGSEKPSNFQLLCGTCNGKKGTKTQTQFEKKLQQDKGKGKAAASKKATPAEKTTTAKKGTTKKATSKPTDPFADLFNF
jgi:5-methylcytosine-specific restriction endonuclease McrA